MDLAFHSEKGAPPINEDLCAALPDLGLYLVCDGLGRGGSGRAASEAAAESVTGSIRGNLFLLEQWRKSGLKDDRQRALDLFSNSVQEASRTIFQMAAQKSELNGMCTTFDGLLFAGSHALIAHVGSGRVYLARNGELHQLTEDHTYLAHMRRTGKAGGLTEAQLQQHAKRLTRAVGFQEQVRVDVLEVEVEIGDKFILITDGVWGALQDSGLSEMLVKEVSFDQLLSALHASVKATGEKDNYTTVIVGAPTGFEKNEAAQGDSAEQKVRMLGKVPAFEYLAYQELVKVLSISDLFKVARGQTICKEGDPGGELMLILNGAVDVMKNNQKIRGLIRGDVFGEMSMLDEAPRSATIVATEPTSLLAFPRDALFTLCHENPTIAVKFMWGLAIEMNKRFRMVSNKLVGRPELEGISSKLSNKFPFHRSK